MKLLPWDYGVRNLGRSRLRLAISLAGSLLVVMLIVTAGGFVVGMERSLVSSGSRQNVILMGAGSEESLERSEISPAVAEIVYASVPGIRSALGVPYVSPEVQLMLSMGLSADPADAVPAQLRGIKPEAFLVHRHLQITHGRAPVAGADELLVGGLAHRRMGVPESRLDLGQQLWLDGRPWTVVGRFAAPGTILEAEVWLPLRDLQVATRRDSLSNVVLTLDQAELGDVEVFCAQRTDLEAVAVRETDYYASLAGFYRPVRMIVWLTALLVAGGGLLGGLNTMYAAFASRVRELATLQAIGFSRRAILVSLLHESVLVCLAGAAAAVVLGLAVLDGISVPFSQGAFGITIDSRIVLLGLGSGLILGILGAVPPAWRCLRLPITTALKAN